MDDEVRRELDALRQRVDQLEAEIARLRTEVGSSRRTAPAAPEVPDPLSHPGPPPGTYPTMG